LVARLIDEEIDAIASPSMRRSIMAEALADGGHESMPVDPEVLSNFVRTGLRRAMQSALGNGAADDVCARLCAMLPAPNSRAASTMPPPVICEPEGRDREIGAMLPHDTVRLAVSTRTVWIIAEDPRSAKALAGELVQLGMYVRIAPSVPPLKGTRSVLILDLRGTPKSTVAAWLRRARESDLIVVVWGVTTESDGSNVHSCEASLTEREVALYCASLTP